MKTLTDNSLITDTQSLNGAKNRFGHAIKVYDDGYGPLFIHRDSMGISGIVRALTWEDAYEVCEDEFFPEADETIDEIIAEYNHKYEHVKYVRFIGHTETRPATPADYPFEEHGLEFAEWRTIKTPAEDGEQIWTENPLFQEAFGFRPNGPNKRDKLGHGIYAKDLNGDRLDMLTPELLKELEITLDISEVE